MDKNSLQVLKITKIDAMVESVRYFTAYYVEDLSKPQWQTDLGKIKRKCSYNLYYVPISKMSNGMLHTELLDNSDGKKSMTSCSIKMQSLEMLTIRPRVNAWKIFY